ncbi:PIG-L family deacetylase [Candidatus Woesearchaeota archaeon]|nr:PIG-L family deacetylase [Candidatus Woesearchaeota archaeon]
MTKNVIFFCPHDDDLTIGGLGFALKLIDEGKSVIQVVFSKGAMSHPHFKEEVIKDIREKETEKVAKKIGLKKLIYFDLKDMSIKEEIEEKNIRGKIKELIEMHKPEKIITVSDSETHPDHRAVNEAVLAVADSLKKKYPVYAFSIWTRPRLAQRPIIYVDISNYFWKKMKILKQHRSQWFSIYLQFLPVIFRARYYGIKNKCRYAEKFEKVR